jgi:hypothetical protein
VALVVGLLGLAVWQAASRAWAVAPDAAVLDAERTLVYAAAAAAAALTVPRRRAPELVLGVLAGTGIATVGGLLEHVLGRDAPPERLELPIGYANASGILAAVTVLLGLGLTADGLRWRAAVGAAVAVPAGAALYLSLSRGSVVALLVGFAALLAVSRSRGLGRVAIASFPCAVSFVAASVGRFDDAALSSREAASLAGLGALALVAAGLAWWSFDAGLPRVPRREVVAVGVLGGIVAAVAIVGDVRDVSAPATQQGAPSRLLVTSTSKRSDYWRVALRMVEREPLLGEGAGSFERAWLRERSALLFARDAHNGYLETLAELGPLGLGLLVFSLGVPLAAARRAVAAPAGAAALAAYVALLVHLVVDWDLELPAVMLCTVFLAVALVRIAGRRDAVRIGGLWRVALAGGALVLGTSAIVIHAGNTATDDAHGSLDRGDHAAARDAAERARRFAPWSAEPRRLLGEAELAAGHPARALEQLRRAATEDPRSWETWLALAFASSGRERAQALERVRTLDPLAPELEAVGRSEDPSKG